MDANKYHITFPKGNALSFPDFKDVKKKNILIFGNVDHIFGCFDGDIQGQELTRYMGNLINFEHMVLNDNTILFMVFEEDKKYIWSMIDKYVEFLKTWYCFDPKLAERFEKKAKKIRYVSIEKYVDGSTLTSDELKSIKPTKSKTFEEIADEIKFKNLMTDKLMKKCKFDYIIQNPPYDGALHLDFLTKGLDLLKEDGKMSIIEPATWLVNIRKNGKAKIYDEIKRRIDGHVEKVVIENLNGVFGTGLYVPFATTTIDISKTFETIDCTICGEHKAVQTIYDVNLVGKYDTIWSILDKVQKYGDMMNNHITNEDKGRDYWYAKYQDIIGGQLKREGNTVCFVNNKFGEYVAAYNSVGYHYYENGIYNAIPNAIGRGKGKSDKNADCIYGTKTELENWKHFIFNNKLPLFINICLTIDQHNNSKQFMPWLVDKQYTDEEINQLFGFSEEEIRLIDTTIKKYERQSPWFKRYMCGPDSVTDQEVMVFMNSL